jgi:competence protein ComEC
MLFVAVAFSLGITAERDLNWSPWVLCELAAGLFLLSLFAYANGRRASPHYSVRVTTAVLLLGFFVAGGLLFQIERLDVAPTRLQKLYQEGMIIPSDPVEIIGQLSRPPESAPQRVYLDLSIEQIKALKRLHPASGQVRLMLSLSDKPVQQLYEQLDLSYGTKIRALTYLRRSNRYRNPGSPDYTEFLDQRGYEASGSLKSPRLITVLARGQGHPVLARLYEFKQRAEAAIDSLFSGQTAAILKALLLGSRHFLSRDVSEVFRAGGTFHILVISGAHVSFLAAILLGLLSAVWRNRWLQFFLVSSLLWAYTLMIGIDQAPVVRATIMTTAALGAVVLFRQAQATNAIGLAAFILLAISPKELFAPGFQLTFLAVVSMVLLAFPLMTRLQAVGSWRPSEDTPQPPRCRDRVRRLAEVLYWDQRGFEREMNPSPIKYHLDKTPLAVALNRWPGLQPLIRAACLSLIVSTVVQMAMLPAMILYFHRVTLGGILLNISVSLLIAVLITSAFVTFAVAELSLRLAPPLIAVTDGIARLINQSMMPMLRVHWASFRAAQYTGWAGLVYLIYFVPLGFFAYALHRWQPFEISSSKSHTSAQRRSGSSSKSQISNLKSRTGRLSMARLFLTRRWSFGLHSQALLVLFLSCFCFMTVHPDGVSHRNGWLTISFLDVNQGDAALVQFPQGTTMLIDSGGRRQLGRPSGESEESEFVEDTLTVGEAVVSNFLWTRGLERVDYILPTHADADHIQGFTDILKNFSVGRALVPRAPARDPEFQEFERARAQAKVPVQFIAAGDRFNIDGVNVDVLWPPRSLDPNAPWGNDESVVMRITYGRRTVLLTGDISQRVESVLVADGLDLKTDVLKVAHHGSRTSSTETFIHRVQPQYAVISVGEHSPFGHPHQEVVKRYQSLGIKLLQTGKCGTITMNTDGERLEVSTFVE